MSYSFRLAARGLLYAPYHRQDITYDSLVYTSCGALAGTKIAQWVQPMKDWSDDPLHHERTLLPQSYISHLKSCEVTWSQNRGDNILMSCVLYSLADWYIVHYVLSAVNFSFTRNTLSETHQSETSHSLCHTSCGALAGTRNSSMGPPWRIDLTTHCTMSGWLV